MEKPIPIKTVRVSAGTRIYYFDAHKDSKGQPYLAITEVPTERCPGQPRRQRIFLHVEDIEKFGDAFAKMENFIVDYLCDGQTAPKP